MPSTYTLNNGIELIGTGEQSGTWGDTTNTNLGLLDTALDGQVSITLASAGNSGSPNNLPISDGAASDGRNRMITFADGGDLGATAFVQLTPNDSEKIIYVRNSLSGSRSIIMFQGTYNASNDYEIPAGTTAVIYFDGAGAGAVAANVFNNAHFDALNVVGNVTVGGDVTVTGTVDAGTVEFDNLSGTGAVSVTNILDEDNMASDSATALSTQQSIKAYVDAQVGAFDSLAEVLAVGNTTGGTDLLVSTGDDITFADNSKAIFGDGSDLQIYHNGSNSYLDEVGTGNLFVRANNLRLSNADNSQYYLIADNSGFLKLNYAGATKLATSATGIDVTGNATFADNGKAIFGAGSDLQIYHTGTYSLIADTSGTGPLRVVTNTFQLNNAADTQNMIAAAEGGAVTLYNAGNPKLATSATGIDVTGTITFDGGSTSADITFGDNDKAIFGAGSDLQIYHDGFHSNIKETGAGSLLIDGANIVFRNADVTKTYVNMTDGGAIDLYHNNALKLATTSTGIDVTGDVGGDSATISGDLTVDTDTLYVDSTNDRVTINSSGSNASGDLIVGNTTGGVFTLTRVSEEIDQNNLLGRIDWFNDDNSGEGENIAAQIGAYAATSLGEDAYLQFHTKAATVGGGTAGNTLSLLSDGTVSVANGGSESSPILVLQGDTDTGQWRPDANTIAWSTGGSEVLRFDSSQRVLIGLTTSEAVASTTAADLQVVTGGIGASIVSTAGASGPAGILALGHKRGAGGPVLDGDGLGDIRFAGHDGTDLESQAAIIRASVDGTPGSNDMPGRLQFYTTAVGASSSTERMRIDSQGFVGINQTDPQNNLDVKGTGGSTQANLRVGGSTGSQASGFRIDHTNAGSTTSVLENLYYPSSTAAAIKLRSSVLTFESGTSATEAMRIDSSQRVNLGVGTAAVSSPQTGFWNGGATGYSGILNIQNVNSSAEGNYVTIAASKVSNDSESAQLGFGKSRGTTANSRTIVADDDYIGLLTFQAADGTDLVESARIAAVVDGTPGANDMPGRLSFWTTADGASSPTERMRIENSGDVRLGIGGSGPIGPKFYGGTPSTGNNGLNIFPEGDGASSVKQAFYVDNTGARIIVRFINPNGIVGAINTSGSSTSYATSSDYRLKENVVVMTGATDRLKQLNPSRFNFIADPDTTVDGFLAHEVQAIVPEAITGTKDAVDADGNPEYQGIDQSKLVPLLVATIQELEARITALENA
jgi:hypothetical protein